MKFSELSQNIVPVTFKRGSHTIELQVNIDAFTPEFMRATKQIAESRIASIETLEKPSKGKTKVQKQLDDWESQARGLEIQRETNIDLLVPHVLKGWDILDDDSQAMPLTKEALLKLPPPMVQDIFNVCMKASQTVKKTDDEVETLENTQDGSPALRVVGQST